VRLPSDVRQMDGGGVFRTSREANRAGNQPLFFSYQRAGTAAIPPRAAFLAVLRFFSPVHHSQGGTASCRLRGPFGRPWRLVRMWGLVGGGRRRQSRNAGPCRQTLAPTDPGRRPDTCRLPRLTPAHSSPTGDLALRRGYRGLRRHPRLPRKDWLFHRRRDPRRVDPQRHRHCSQRRSSPGTHRCCGPRRQRRTCRPH